MARLANDRNELYARHRAKGMNAAKAALAAGYAPGSSTTHLEQDADIVARIAELFEEQQAQRAAQREAAIEAAKVVGQMTGVSRAWVITKLAENAQNAASDGQFKESNAALELIGKDFGMFTGGSGDDPSSNVPKTMDLDKLDGLLGQTMEGLIPEAKSDAALSREFGNETAMELIQGMMVEPVKPAKPPKAEKVNPRDRRLTTGSETDVALLDPIEDDAMRRADSLPTMAEIEALPTDDDEDKGLYS